MECSINFDNQQDFSNAFDTLDSLPDVIRLLQSDNQAVANIRLQEGAVVELRINLSEQQHSSNDTLSETSTTQDIFKTEKGLPVSLADSNDFLLTPEGNSILSVIDEQTAKDAGIKPGGIRANVGALRHAESGHGKQITEAGYDSVQAFLLDVLNNWSQIWEGTKGSYLLVRPLQNKHHGAAAIQLVLDNDGGYHVTTLMYRNDKAWKNKKLLTAGRPSPATSSGSGSNLTRAALASSEKSTAKGDSSSEQLNINSLAVQTESVNQQQSKSQEQLDDELLAEYEEWERKRDELVFRDYDKLIEWEKAPNPHGGTNEERIEAIERPAIKRRLQLHAQQQISKGKSQQRIIDFFKKFIGMDLAQARRPEFEEGKRLLIDWPSVPPLGKYIMYDLIDRTGLINIKDLHYEYDQQRSKIENTMRDIGEDPANAKWFVNISERRKMPDKITDELKPQASLPSSLR